MHRRLSRPFLLTSLTSRRNGFVVTCLLKYVANGEVYLVSSNRSEVGCGKTRPEKKYRQFCSSSGRVHGGSDLTVWLKVPHFACLPVTLDRSRDAPVIHRFRQLDANQPRSTSKDDGLQEVLVLAVLVERRIGRLGAQRCEADGCESLEVLCPEGQDVAERRVRHKVLRKDAGESVVAASQRGKSGAPRRQRSSSCLHRPCAPSCRPRTQWHRSTDQIGPYRSWRALCWMYRQD